MVLRKRYGNDKLIELRDWSRQRQLKITADGARYRMNMILLAYTREGNIRR